MDNIISNMDCREGLTQLPENTIDLTVCSPPYNLDLGNNKHNKTHVYDGYDDNMPYVDYLQFLREVFTLVFEKTVSGGRCVVNIGDRKNGKIPTHVDLSLIMQQIGWMPYATILWDKGSTTPRTAWGSFQSPSSPSFPTPFEFILVFSKDSYKLGEKGVSDLTKQEFIDWSLALWRFSGEKRSKVNHPAPFPVELPLRCVKMFSWVGATVCDPFAGSFTTGIVCQRTKRRFIGFEQSKEYFDYGLERMAGESHLATPP